MPINVATVRTATYFPELIPDVNTMNVAISTEVDILDLRRYGNRILRLNDINTEQNPNIELRIFNDKEKYYINTNALYNRLVEKFEVYGIDFIRAALIDTTAPIANYRVNYNLWVKEPTTADKLIHGINLTQQDNEILDAIDIATEVNKGNIPLPVEYQLQREYQLVDGRRTFTYNGNCATVEQVLQSFPTNPDEIAVLESISAAPNAVANNVRIRVDRDDDIDYVELNTFPMQLNVPVTCFLPATREIKIKLIGGVAVATQVQWTIARYKLTDVLRIRFGLVTKDETDAQLWNKVKGGVY